jgi:hypothetical protein
MNMLRATADDGMDHLLNLSEKHTDFDDIMSNLNESILERLEEWEEDSFEMMCLMESIANKNTGIAGKWALTYMEQIVDRLQHDIMTPAFSPRLRQFCTLLQPHTANIIDIIHQRTPLEYVWHYTLECLSIAGGVTAATRTAELLFTRDNFNDQTFEVFESSMSSFAVHLENFETYVNIFLSFNRIVYS